MDKVINAVELASPAKIYEAAELYVTAPINLSHEVRSIFGHVYRDFLGFEGEQSMPSEISCRTFPKYAIRRWKEGTFPRDALS